MLSYIKNQFCYIFFQFWEILSQTRVSFLRNSIKDTYLKLGKK